MERAIFILTLTAGKGGGDDVDVLVHSEMVEHCLYEEVAKIHGG